MKETWDRDLMRLPMLGTSVYILDDFTLHTGTGIGGERVEKSVLFELDLTGVTRAVLDIVWEAGPDSVQFQYYVNGFLVFDTGWLDFGGSGVRTVDISSYLFSGDNKFLAVLSSPLIRIVDRYATYTVTLTETWEGEPPKPPVPKTDWSKIIMENLPIIVVGTVGLFAVGYVLTALRPSS